MEPKSSPQLAAKLTLQVLLGLGLNLTAASATPTCCWSKWGDESTCGAVEDKIWHGWHRLGHRGQSEWSECFGLCKESKGVGSKFHCDTARLRLSTDQRGEL